MNAEQRRIDWYLKIMREFALRLESIEACFNGDLKIEPSLSMDYCFLQLRMSCELIALGCLVAHGNLLDTQGASIRKEYHASKVVNQLEKLHSRFYPQPIKIVSKIGGVTQIEDDPIEHLTKQKLVALNARCGDRLHRGSMKKLLSGPEEHEVLLNETKIATQLLANLVGFHAVVMKGDERVILCQMRGGENGGVRVMAADAM